LELEELFTLTQPKLHILFVLNQEGTDDCEFDKREELLVQVSDAMRKAIKEGKIPSYPPKTLLIIKVCFD
jgi:hypothetical protein